MDMIAKSDFSTVNLPDRAQPQPATNGDVMDLMEIFSQTGKTEQTVKV
jgi:hypothetical protein